MFSQANVDLPLTSAYHVLKDLEQKTLPISIHETLSQCIKQFGSINSWSFIKKNHHTSLYQHPSNNRLYCASDTVEGDQHITLQQLCDNLEVAINPFTKIEQTIFRISRFHEIKKTESQFINKGTYYKIVEQYQKYIVEQNNYTCILRTPLSSQQKQYDQKLETHSLSNHLLYSKNWYEQKKNAQVEPRGIETIPDVPEPDTPTQKSYSSMKSINIGKQISIPTHIPFECPKIDVVDEKNQTNQVDVRDYYVVNFNDTCDFLDRRYDPALPAFKFEKQHDRINDLDEEELEVFREFKARYRDYHLSDNILIRFLTSRGFNLDASTDLLDQQIQWRKAERINWLDESDFADYQAMKIFHLVAYDKIGRCVAWSKMGKLQPSKMQIYIRNVSQPERFTKFFISFLEKVARCSLGLADSYLTIVDVEGFGWANFNMELVKGMMKSVMQYFPERQYKVYVINVSIITKSIFRLMKPFLPQRTLDKLVFVGTNPDQIKEALLQDMELDQIPQKYGGGNKYDFD